MNDNPHIATALGSAHDSDSVISTVHSPHLRQFSKGNNVRARVKAIVFYRNLWAGYLPLLERYPPRDGAETKQPNRVVHNPVHATRGIRAVNVFRDLYVGHRPLLEPVKLVVTINVPEKSLPALGLLNSCCGVMF